MRGKGFLPLVLAMSLVLMGVSVTTRPAPGDEGVGARSQVSSDGVSTGGIVGQAEGSEVAAERKPLLADILTREAMDQLIYLNEVFATAGRAGEEKGTEAAVAYMRTLTGEELLLLSGEMDALIQQGKADDHIYMLLGMGGFVEKVPPLLTMEDLAAILRNPELDGVYRYYILDAVNSHYYYKKESQPRAVDEVIAAYVGDETIDRGERGGLLHFVADPTIGIPLTQGFIETSKTREERRRFERLLERYEETARWLAGRL